MPSENASWLLTIVGLIGILALLLLLICRYLGGGEWTSWTRAWLTSSSREEKMILTRGGTGQYHPNGFMIPSDSDLNISGGGSFRRFDRTIDYQLLRQGSTVSQQQNSSNIPPQPLRPAPILPVPKAAAPATTKTVASTTTTTTKAIHLEEQSSLDSVFADSPPPISPSPPVSMPPPPPRIPPPNKSTVSNFTAPTQSSSNATTTTGRTLPSFSMTNPFLPLLQASTQFFSQTLQGFQSFQNSAGVGNNSSSSSQQPPPSSVAATTATNSSHNNNYGHHHSSYRSSSSAPSSATTKLSMGELLFSAPPAVSSSSSSSPPPIQEEDPPLSTTSSLNSAPPFQDNYNSGQNPSPLISDFESSYHQQNQQKQQQFQSGNPLRRQSSNPFSPQSSFTSSFDSTTVLSATSPPPSSPPIPTTTSLSSSQSQEGQENFKNRHLVKNDNEDDKDFYGPTTTIAAKPIESTPPPPPATINPPSHHEDNIFNWTTPLDRPTSLLDHPHPRHPPPHQDEPRPSGLSQMTTRTMAVEEPPIPPPASISELEQLLSRNSIFDQIRDFNELSMSRNEQDDQELIKQISSISTTSNLTTTTVQSQYQGEEKTNSLINHGNMTTTTMGITKRLEEKQFQDTKNQNGNGNEESLTNNPILKGGQLNNSVIPTTGGGGHYSNFTPYRAARSFSLRQTSTDSIGSDGSDLTSPDGSLLPTIQRALSCDSVCSNSSIGELPLHLAGQLCIGLEYDSDTADLIVTVNEAREINPDVTAVRPESNNSVPLSTYVRVYLLPDKTTNMQTRVYRKSLNPMYKEKFMFGLEIAEFPIRSLVFYMYATDKFSNTLIGEAELKLGDLDILQLPTTTWLPLTDTGQRGGGDLGEIMFSLSYLPTAERLTVVVVKGRNLKFPRENRSSGQDPVENVGDPFVKVYLLQRGKKVSKKKSSTKRGEKNPIFNEAMIFGVPAHALQTIQLRITVADSAECESNRAYSIGHVVVGSTATGKPLSHWNQMLSSLRKPIAMWHSLRK